MNRAERLHLWRAMVAYQARKGWLPSAEGCTNWTLARAPFHPYAREGVSFCLICKRLVIRSEGRWWE